MLLPKYLGRFRGGGIKVSNSFVLFLSESFAKKIHLCHPSFGDTAFLHRRGPFSLLFKIVLVVYLDEIWLREISEHKGKSYNIVAMTV